MRRPYDSAMIRTSTLEISKSGDRSTAASPDKFALARG
jgi:hypothetical protein